MRTVLYFASGRLAVLEGEEGFIQLNLERLGAGDAARALDGGPFANAKLADLPTSASAYDAAVSTRRLT